VKKGYLSEYFTDVGWKHLSAVEAERHRSNQHEFDGVTKLRTMLGAERRRFEAQFIYLDDEDTEPTVESGFLTWYDARENHPTRSEWRLYFPTTRVSERAAEGDLLTIGRRPDDTIVVIIADAGSTAESQIKWLFGFSDLLSRGYALKTETDSDRMRLGFASRLILEQIGVVGQETDESFLDQMLWKFGTAFPSTREFSAWARETIDGTVSDATSDQILLAWLEREEMLFRTLERHLIEDRLKQGFVNDVDEFLRFSLSVQNRRKSRAGSALENHLEALFEQRGIRHTRTPKTEGKARPDFVFPGAEAYHDAHFPTSNLTMLGVKSSCKERWRQVLAEADRIDEKHLLTLEPRISTAQTDEMRSRQLQLVLPLEIQASYSSQQQAWLMSVDDFLNLVSSRQALTH
jgi:hypothetical protein